MNSPLANDESNLKRNTKTLQKYDYGYGQIDASGNLDVTKNNGQLAKIDSYIGAAKQWTQKFSYDAIGRLDKSEEYRGDTNALSYRQKFDYDRFGNLYRKAASNQATGQENPFPFTPIEDADISKQTNRLTTDTQYDDAGNVVQDTQFRSQNFWYDANGRMIKTANTNNINKSNAVYDASGMRVATQVDDVWTFYVYDAMGKKVAEYGGLQATDEGGVKYVLQDHQGSSRAILNSSGYVQARMDYTAFGEEINSNVGLRTTAQGFGANETLNNKYALTERDKATGLDHTWFRKHENRAGRWTSPDPYNGSMSLSNPQSFNRYSYVENQPTNFVDPSGLQASSGNRMCFTITREWYKDGVYSHSEYVGSFCIGGGGGGGGGGNAHNSGFGSGGGGGSPEGKKGGDSDCERFADIVDSIVNEVFNNPATNSFPHNVNAVMDRIASRFTGMSSATLISAYRNSRGGETREGFDSTEFGSTGFKPQFFEEPPGNNQVRHATGGLIAGYTGIGLERMNGREKGNGAKATNDRNLNGMTVPMGEKLAGPGSEPDARNLGNWIRKNLCE